jgi:2-polyprenyl-6-methoxyphenol hydroxylase-like FAD-dependent oxidoreductase
MLILISTNCFRSKLLSPCAGFFQWFSQQKLEVNSLHRTTDFCDRADDMRDSADVLVVGAGPVGLFLACELQRLGVDYLLVEKVPERAYFCKAMGVTPRTLEIFGALGIVDEAIDAGVWLDGMTAFDNGVETESQDPPFKSLPYGFLALPQYETERILEGCLYRHGGSVQRGMTLDSFTDGPAGVETRVIDAAGTVHLVRCRWLVGCDGARSAVRKALGMDFSGDQYPMTFMLGDVELDWNLPRGRFYRFRYLVEGQLRNMMVAVPIRGSTGRYRLSMGAPEAMGAAHEGIGAEAGVPPTLEQLERVTRPMLPPDVQLSHLRWSSVYRISHRIVPNYSVGRVFLAGDAAHIHPPIGGQGMNTGLQDAHNLSWKLGLVAQGIAEDRFLESYSAERHPVGMDVVEQTSRAMDETMASGSVGRVGQVRESQLFINYRSSAWVQDEVAESSDEPGSPRAGDRAPDATGLSRPFVAHRLRLRERLERGHHLLIGYTAGNSAGADQRRFADLVERTQKRLGGLAAGLLIVAAGADFVSSELIPVLSDQEESFKQGYGARPGMAWLIRPDGHIGWRSDRPDPEQFGRFLKRIAAR